MSVIAFIIILLPEASWGRESFQPKDLTESLRELSDLWGPRKKKNYLLVPDHFS